MYSIPFSFNIGQPQVAVYIGQVSITMEVLLFYKIQVQVLFFLHNIFKFEFTNSSMCHFQKKKTWLQKAMTSYLSWLNMDFALIELDEEHPYYLRSTYSSPAEG